MLSGSKFGMNEFLHFGRLLKIVLIYTYVPRPCMKPFRYVPVNQKRFSMIHIGWMSLNEVFSVFLIEQIKQLSSTL